MQEHSVVIIGAGLTGLSCTHGIWAAITCSSSARPSPAASSAPASVTTPSNVRRHRPLACILRNPAMKELVNELLPGGLVEYERKAVIFSKGVFTLYPFQANTFGLPREVVLECLTGLLKAKHPEDFGLKPPAGPPANFHEWILRAFGEGIAKHFMVPNTPEMLGRATLTEMMPAYAERFIPRPVHRRCGAAR